MADALNKERQAAADIKHHENCTVSDVFKAKSNSTDLPAATTHVWWV